MNKMEKSLFEQMGGTYGATRRANARNTIFTLIRSGIARLAIIADNLIDKATPSIIKGRGSFVIFSYEFGINSPSWSGPSISPLVAMMSF